MTKKQLEESIKAVLHNSGAGVVVIQIAEGGSNAQIAGNGNNVAAPIVGKLIDEIAAQRKLTEQVLEQSMEQNEKLTTLIQQLTARNKALTEQIKIKSHDQKTIRGSL